MNAIRQRGIRELGPKLVLYVFVSYACPTTDSRVPNAALILFWFSASGPLVPPMGVFEPDCAGVANREVINPLTPGPKTKPPLIPSNVFE